MIEGLMRQATVARVDRNYTDSHGASVVAFAFAHLLGFRLLPRLKNIGSVRLYRPAAGGDGNPWPWPRARVVTARVRGATLHRGPATQALRLAAG